MLRSQTATFMPCIALISDIHGNLVALDEVLSAISHERVDEIICLGDVALGGPQPRECVRRLQALGIRCVMGNHDARRFESVDQVYADRAHAIDDIDCWSFAQLAPDDLAYMRSFAPTIALPLANDETLLCCHGSPRSNTDIVSEDTPEADLARMFDGWSANLYAGGHSHKQMLRAYGSGLILNGGSIGLPWVYGPNGQHHNSCWAGYALVDSRPGVLNVELRRLLLDMPAISRAAHASGMPHVDWWLAEWDPSETAQRPLPD